MQNVKLKEIDVNNLLGKGIRAYRVYESSFIEIPDKSIIETKIKTINIGDYRVITTDGKLHLYKVDSITHLKGEIVAKITRNV